MNTGFMRSNAVANVKGGKEFPDISGQVKFYQKSNGVLVVADISGLPRNTSGFFALHIHEGDNCRGENFSDTKGHFNLNGQEVPRLKGGGMNCPSAGRLTCYCLT